MRFVQTFDPTAASSGNITIGTGDPGQKVLIYNESAVTIELNFQNGNIAYIHAWEANYWTLPLPLYNITWSSIRNLVGAGQAPASYVDVFVYDANERVEGTYPTQLARLVSTGNLIAVASTATNLINDGNASLSQIVEATQTGSSGSNVSLDNSGNMVLKQYVAATLTTLFQVIANAGGGASNVKLSDAQHQCEVLGNLLVDLALTVTGNATVNGNLTVAGSFSAGSLQATTLVNDGAASSTQVIEAKQSGSSGSNVSIDNSGNMTLKQYVAATLTTIFQTIANAANGTSNVKLSDGNHQCEVLGSLLVDAATTLSGSLTVTGASTLNSSLSVAGTSTLTGDATFAGKATINGGGTALTVANKAQINGDLNVAGNIIGQQNLELYDAGGVAKIALFIDSGGNLNIQQADSGTKIYFISQSGTKWMSLSNTGNLTVKGTVTANGTP